MADALREDERPTLVLWADSDSILPFSVGERVSEQLNFPAPIAIENAGHFLQEDAGPEVGRLIADWLWPTAVPSAPAARREVGQAGAPGAARPRPRPR